MGDDLKPWKQKKEDMNQESAEKKVVAVLHGTNLWKYASPFTSTQGRTTICALRFSKILEPHCVLWSRRHWVMSVPGVLSAWRTCSLADTEIALFIEISYVFLFVECCKSLQPIFMNSPCPSVKAPIVHLKICDPNSVSLYFQSRSPRRASKILYFLCGRLEKITIWHIKEHEAKWSKLCFSKMEKDKSLTKSNRISDFSVFGTICATGTVNTVSVYTILLMTGIAGLNNP